MQTNFIALMGATGNTGRKITGALYSRPARKSTAFLSVGSLLYPDRPRAEKW
jgi:hypothetical protein